MQPSPAPLPDRQRGRRAALPTVAHRRGRSVARLTETH
jgi:hypothetical protein